MSVGDCDDYDDCNDEDNYNLKMQVTFLRTMKACHCTKPEPFGMFQHFLPLAVCLL